MGSPVQKVCVQGLGYVGAAMSAAVAEARNGEGRPLFEVVGIDLPTPHGLQRVEALNSGRFPFETGDCDLEAAVRRGHDNGNLSSTVDPAAYERADVVIVDVHLDVAFDNHPPVAKLDGFASAIRTLANRIRPGTLVIIETTVPPGTTERVV